MFKKIINFIFLLSQFRDNKIIHYRMAKINGEPGCVEANVSKKMAEQIQAKPGKCSDVDCFIYRGKSTIPLCCKIQAYSCNDFI